MWAKVKWPPLVTLTRDHVNLGPAKQLPWKDARFGCTFTCTFSPLHASFYPSRKAVQRIFTITHPVTPNAGGQGLTCPGCPLLNGKKVCSSRPMWFTFYWQSQHQGQHLHLELKSISDNGSGLHRVIHYLFADLRTLTRVGSEPVSMGHCSRMWHLS